VQALGGAAEVQLLRDGDEVTQLTKLHETDSDNDSIELKKILDTITDSGVGLTATTCPSSSPAPTAGPAK
jgi:hypothetical protein